MNDGQDKRTACSYINVFTYEQSSSFGGFVFGTLQWQSFDTKIPHLNIVGSQKFSVIVNDCIENEWNCMKFQQPEKKIDCFCILLETKAVRNEQKQERGQHKPTVNDFIPTSLIQKYQWNGQHHNKKH